MSEAKTFLLELHCEEIPARFLKPLWEGFAHALEDELDKWFPTGDSASYWLNAIRHSGGFYSPRKLAFRLHDLPVQQPDQTETQSGPPQRMCVDEAGQPTIQGLKFAEKWGVDFNAVRFELPSGKKESCAVVAVIKKGRPTLELLAEALPGLIAGLHVPKAMRWGKSEFEFVRPIRNILCLFGDQVVPITVDGVTATNTTWGHRLHHRQHPEPVQVAVPESYETALAAAGVVVSVEARRASMAEQLDSLAREAGGRVVTDEELLDTLAEIVEFPKIVRGYFPAEFLDLPKEVLVTSLREHQKSFCIEKSDGTLLQHFLTAANRPDDPAGFVKSGNEWVLKARLYDGRFFYAEDRKQPLLARLDNLKALTFQRDLGSYFEKTERVIRLADQLAEMLKLDRGQAQEAARLAKCDLRTLMVGEFPELQGIMGGQYLKLEGAPEAVWMAVREHYRPAGADDAIPSTPMGCLLSLCDKLDTVSGCFAVGIIPSGSKDPLALRRAGLGIVRILWERNWTVTIPGLISMGLSAVGSKGAAKAEETRTALLDFFRDRVAYQLEQAGYAGSVRRSAMAAGWEDLVDLKDRCGALSDFAEDARFSSLAQSAKRIGNILKDESPTGTFELATLQEPSEKALAGHLNTLESCTDHTARLAALTHLAEPLEAFFTAVMVKCEDPALRNARLSLLHRLRRTFLRVADFSLWQ